MRRILLAILLALFLGASYLAYSHFHTAPPPETPPAPIVLPASEHHSIGTSVQGRDIEAYTYGNGSTTLMFVGGIHGAYEWNSVALAYQFIDYLDAHRDAVPQNEKIVVIPDLNPDALYNGLGLEGRFVTADTAGKDLTKFRGNANEVDLNRNFDCNWSSKGVWQGKPEKTGSEAFSEPETKAFRDFALKTHPAAVVFWHSMANAVYASQCNDGILPETLNVMNVYAEASGYKAVKTFDAYVVTGAGEDWLASQHIPAITVEMSTHDSTEWEKNIAGSQALIRHYAQ